VVTELGIPQTGNDLGTSHSKCQGIHIISKEGINSKKISLGEKYLQTHCIFLKPLNELP